MTRSIHLQAIDRAMVKLGQCKARAETASIEAHAAMARAREAGDAVKAALVAHDEAIARAAGAQDRHADAIESIEVATIELEVETERALLALCAHVSPASGTA